MKTYDFLLENLKKQKGHIPEIARKAQVGTSTIQNWITGGNMPTLDNAEKVLNALGYGLIIRLKECK